MPNIYVHYFIDSQDVEWFSKKICRQVLEILHRKTFNDLCALVLKPPTHPKTEEYETPKYYTAEQIFNVLEAQEYLRAGYGQHSKEDYLKLRRTNTLEREFKRLGISDRRDLNWRRLIERFHAIKEQYKDQYDCQTTTVIEIQSTTIQSTIDSPTQQELRQAG